MPLNVFFILFYFCLWHVVVFEVYILSSNSKLSFNQICWNGIPFETSFWSFLFDLILPVDIFIGKLNTSHLWAVYYHALNYFQQIYSGVISWKAIIAKSFEHLKFYKRWVKTVWCLVVCALVGNPAVLITYCNVRENETSCNRAISQGTLRHRIRNDGFRRGGSAKPSWRIFSYYFYIVKLCQRKASSGSLEAGDFARNTWAPTVLCPSQSGCGSHWRQISLLKNH